MRLRGFTAPAAGKTGSSHDGWFAGYTSNLLCIVWVGYDDYSDLRLSGAQTAAPIWTEFMKKAITLPQYADVKPFSQPEGVVDVQLDKVTNRLATPSCPDTYTIAFVAGTEPRDTCDQSTGVPGILLADLRREFGESRFLPRTTGTRRLPVVSKLMGTLRRKRRAFSVRSRTPSRAIAAPMTKTRRRRLSQRITARNRSNIVRSKGSIHAFLETLSPRLPVFVRS